MVTDFSTLSFFLMFTYPGVLVHVIYKKFLPRSDTDDRFKDLPRIFLYSTAIFFFVLLIMKTYFCDPTKYDLSTITNISSYFSDIEFLITYMITTGIISVLFSIVWHIFVDIILVHINNRLFAANKAKVSSKSTIWECIFENKKNSPMHRVVSIEKGGQVIKRGIIGGWTPPDIDKKEILLCHSTLIDEYFCISEDPNIETIYFDQVEYSYFDLDNDLVINFFNMDKYNEYVKPSN